MDLKAENVAITVGATEAIHLAFRMLLNSGDEVIIIGPTWAQCPNDVLLCGAKPIIADKFASGFLPDLDYLRTLVTDKTKIIVVNSPNNPTGTVYPKELLKGIPHLKYEVPDATFYLFTDISETGLDSRAMCTGLLEKEHVAITPGLSFGDAFDGYIRLAFTLEEDVIREGIGRIRHFMESLD